MVSWLLNRIVLIATLMFCQKCASSLLCIDSYISAGKFHISQDGDHQNCVVTQNGQLIVVHDELPESTHYHLCWTTMITSTCCKNIVPLSTTVLSGKFTKVGPCACAFQCGSREHWIRSMYSFIHLSNVLNEQYQLCQSSTFYNCSLGQQLFQIGLSQFVLPLAKISSIPYVSCQCIAFTYHSGLISFKASKCKMYM